MKKMSSLVALSISTAIFCGIWSCVAGIMGLLGWAGFAGCTTYFASGKHGILGLRKTIIPNLTGVICGMMIITLSNIVPVLGDIGIWCAIITFVMCFISKYKWLDFCPGIFMGCFTTFAANGDWKMLSVSLMIGAFLGFACDYGGSWLYKTTRGEERN